MRTFEFLENEPPPGPLLLGRGDDPGEIYWVGALVHIVQIRSAADGLKSDPGPRGRIVKMLADEILTLTEEILAVL